MQGGGDEDGGGGAGELETQETNGLFREQHGFAVSWNLFKFKFIKLFYI